MIIAIAIVFSKSYDVLSARIEESYSQSFIRFGIWEDTLSYVQQRPWFGWGFAQELKFRQCHWATGTHHSQPLSRHSVERGHRGWAAFAGGDRLWFLYGLEKYQRKSGA